MRLRRQPARRQSFGKAFLLSLRLLSEASRGTSAMAGKISLKPESSAWRLAAAAVRRLAVRDDGATAVDFALVAAPFMALLFAILETGLVFFAGQTLETTAADASRLIQTGQAQNQSFDQAAFQQALCQRAWSFFNCDNLMIDVRTYNDFSSANTSSPIDQNGNLQNNFVYQPGSAGDIVVVRVMYQWPVYVSLFGLNSSFSNLANGNDLMMATVAFRNEPYQ
jgi:Flp pilus assembly protein TadG